MAITRPYNEVANNYTLEQVASWDTIEIPGEGTDLPNETEGTATPITTGNLSFRPFKIIYYRVELLQGEKLFFKMPTSDPSFIYTGLITIIYSFNSEGDTEAQILRPPIWNDLVTGPFPEDRTVFFQIIGIYDQGSLNPEDVFRTFLTLRVAYAMSNADLLTIRSKSESILVDVDDGEFVELDFDGISVIIRRNGYDYTWSQDNVVLTILSEVGDSERIAIGEVPYIITYSDTGSAVFDIVEDETTGTLSDNTIVVYREGDADSEEVADLYATTWGLSDSSKIGIPCSSQEILANHTEFRSEVESPILSAIGILNKVPRVIVLGYNVPGGFIDDSDNEGDIISSTSRISRISHNFTKKVDNTLFDRREVKRYSESDEDFAIITSRIDAPTVDLAKNMINRSANIVQQQKANGTFYLDIYSDKSGSDATTYQNALVDFELTLLPSLNLDIWSTTFLDPYIDVVIPSVTNDSFIWSWFTDRSSISFFRDTNASRAFSYNADNDGGYSVRSLTDRRWPVLSIKSGYAATAGAMSTPGYDGMLYPTPFFRTLNAGGTIGEAFLFSQRYLDWTISVFGDPLMFITFPAQPDAVPTGNSLNVITVDEDGVTRIEEIESWRLMLKDLARSMAHYVRKTDFTQLVLNTVVASTDIPTTVDLLDPAHQLRNNYSDLQRQSEYEKVIQELLRHMEVRSQYNDLLLPIPSASQILIDMEEKVSELVYDAQQDNNRLALINIHDEGYWEFETRIQDEAGAFAFYHFELEVSNTADFSNILMSKKSIEDQINWQFEEHVNEFNQVGVGGVISSFVGRRIRYTSQSDEYLDRAGIYYFRIRQRDQLTIHDFSEFADIIYT